MKQAMQTKRIVPVLGIGLILAGVGGIALMSAQSAQSASKNEPKNAAIAWTQEEQQIIGSCRAEGQSGLDRLRLENATVIQKLQQGSMNKGDLRLGAMLDAVSQQKDSAFSGLYWYTDLKEARRVAEEKGLPILSLRLLGKLTDERSCANSRFFRSVLYPNAKLSEFLRNNFVLHWSSERPVPLVTIDYGDGRRLETTLTGNSIHYVLAADGTPIDALPGLFSPAVFQYRLQRAHSMAKTWQTSAQANQRMNWLKGQHRMAINRLQLAWNREASKAEKRLISRESEPENSAPAPENAMPEVVRAEFLTESKVRVENPVLAKLLPEHIAPDKTVKTDPLWQKLAETRLKSENPIDANSRALMRRKLNKLSEAEFEKTMASFGKQIMMDCAHNDYLLHRKVHQWLRDAPGTNLADLNTRVYAELFLTPASDPWLGLLMEGQYTGLPNSGVIQPVAH